MVKAEPTRPRIGTFALPPLKYTAPLVACAILALANAFEYALSLAVYPRDPDFYLTYLAAQVGRTIGWTHIYDPAVYLPLLKATSHRWMPYLNTPVTAWTAVPFTFLPWPVAIAIWNTLILGSLVMTWRLIAVGSRLARVTLLVAALGLYPIELGLRLGQNTFLVLAGVAIAWWLIRQDRQFLAGLALTALVLKPQVALLLPVALFVAGYRRTVLGFLVGTVPLAVLSVLQQGAAGIDYWRAASSVVYQLHGLRLHSLIFLLHGQGEAAIILVALAVTVLIAWRSRQRSIELVMAAGLAGSMLVAPYLNVYDMAGNLLVGAWLVLRLRPPAWVKLLMVVGYIDLMFAWAPFGTWPSVLLQPIWLLVLLVLSGTPKPARVTNARPIGRRGRRIVVLPAYRAAKTVRDVVAQIPRAEVDGILLVDDASADRTAELALELGIDVIKHPRNLGYGGNQKTCYANALLKGADTVVMLHPDGQYDPGLVPALCAAVEEGKGDIVLGSRWLGLDPAAAGMPWWKQIGNRFLTSIENQVLQLHLSEYHTGYRAYSRQFLETVPFVENSNDFVFDSQVLFQAARFGFRIAEIPAVGRYFREASSVGFKTSIVYGLKTLLALAVYVANRLGFPCRWLDRPLGVSDHQKQRQAA